MANPAQLLLDLLNEWSGPVNQAPESARRPDGAAVGDPEFWRYQAGLVDLLLDVEAALDAIAASRPSIDVRTYRRQLRPTYELVFGYQPVWKAQRGTTAKIQRLAPNLDGLRMTAGLLDVYEEDGMPQEGIDVLRQTLRDADELIDAATYLDSKVRGYLLSLIAHARSLLEADVINDAAVRDAALRLSGAMTSTAETTAVPVEQRGFFRRFSTIFATAVLSSAGTEAGQHLITVAEKVPELLPGHGN